MNMYSLGEPCCRGINEELFDVYEEVATASMLTAATETKGKYSTPDNIEKLGLSYCRVSLDGSWQKRGHASLNGVVTAMSNGKCVDVHVLSKYCRQCQIWQRRKGTDIYDKWKVTHVCKINHVKSSGAMEGVGAVEMFFRSVTKNTLIYNEYLGDGDTSSFKEVVASAPYADYDVVPEKIECVGHVQKRLGTRIRNKVKEYKGTETPLSCYAQESLTRANGFSLR